MHPAKAIKSGAFSLGSVVHFAISRFPGSARYGMAFEQQRL